MSEHKTDRPRRKFMLSAIILGLAGSLGWYRGMRLFRRKDSKQSVHMITRTGEVVEINPEYIKSKSSTPLSDEELEQFKLTNARHRSQVQED